MDTADVTTNRGYRTLVSVGLVSYGLVHVVMAWIAMRLAWGGGGGEASSQGALQEMADQPLGTALLGVVAVGLFALVVWQGLEAAIGHTHVTALSARAGGSLPPAKHSSTSPWGSARRRSLSAPVAAGTPRRPSPHACSQSRSGGSSSSWWGWS